MENKEIIIDGEHDMNYCEDNNCKHYGNKEECEKTHCYYRCYSKLYTELKAKEQECERLEEANNTLTITREKLLGDLCIVEESLKDYTEHYNIQSEEIDQLKPENWKLKQTLTEIKPILELYANSKIGEEQLDGTYKITVKNSSVLGDTYITFDPRPAKQALQKISEYEVKND